MESLTETPSITELANCSTDETDDNDGDGKL